MEATLLSESHPTKCENIRNLTQDEIYNICGAWSFEEAMFFADSYAGGMWENRGSIHEHENHSPLWYLIDSEAPGIGWGVFRLDWFEWTYYGVGYIGTS